MTQPVKREESPEFKAFWDIWRPVQRNTDGRGLARETFRKHVLNGVDPQDIVDGAAWFIRNLSDKTRDYVPLSSTWLNRESYLDLCDKEREYQARISRPAENVIPIKPISTYRPAFLREYEQKKGSL